jgi:hypothetical protein
MTDLERFEKYWNGSFEHTSWTSGIDGLTKRAYKTREKYEAILFSIWKNHRDWQDEDEDNGFQINCKENRTIYRVRKLAEEAGLLNLVRNYSVGNHTRTYHKNNILFDLIYRDKQNKYGNWLNKVRDNKEQDIINDIHLDDINKLKIPYVDTSLKYSIPKTKIKKLNYDIEKLYILSNTMRPYYHKLLLKLNNSVIDKRMKLKADFNPDDFKLKSFLYFDQTGLPKGRPWSYFCSTLNDQKKHKKIDISFKFRNVFLNEIGLNDYFEVYDIKSEIPRVNWLFHTGEWKDDNYDFYSEIIKDTGMLKYFDWEIQRSQTQYSEYEDSMKQLFMRVYFGKGSDKQSFNGYEKDKRQRILDNTAPQCWTDLDKLNWKERKTGRNNFRSIVCIFGKNCPNIKTCNAFKDLDKWETEKKFNEDTGYEIWTDVCNSVRKVCGKSIGSLIFWYAFFIETEVKIELLRRGKVVYNVYDGFYFNQDITNEIKDIINIKAKYVYNKFMKPIIR